MEKMRQIPLGGPESDPAIVEEMERAVAQENADENERALIADAMRKEGFISYEERKKQRTEGPGRKAWLALGKKLHGEDGVDKK